MSNINLKEIEILNATKEFATSHKIHYDELTESMILNAIRAIRTVDSSVEDVTSDENSKEEYNPYCPLCDSCGEDGCCTHLACFRTLVESNNVCRYGQTYLRDARYVKICLDEVMKFVQNKLKLTPEEEKEYDDIFNKNYDLVYKEE